jgi:hypothetical protein
MLLYRALAPVLSASLAVEYHDEQPSFPDSFLLDCLLFSMDGLVYLWIGLMSALEKKGPMACSLHAMLVQSTSAVSSLDQN